MKDSTTLFTWKIFLYFQYELFNKFIIVEPSLMIQENKQYSIILEAQWIEPVLPVRSSGFRREDSNVKS